MQKRTLSSLIIPLTLFIIGVIILVVSKDGIISNASFVLFGLIPTFFSQTWKDKIRNNDIVTKLGRFFDPLRGKPRCESNGIRYYNSRTQLPEFDSILEIKGLKQIDILSITSYPLLSNFDQQIRESINKDVNINFLLLHPESKFVDIQRQNFRGNEELKYQITESLKRLVKIYSELDNNYKNNLSVKLYHEQIGKGIMIVHLKNDSWIKVKTYIIGSNNTLRNSETVYEKDNPKFYNEHESEFKKILNSIKTTDYNLQDG
jgi:hypothetical protein